MYIYITGIHVYRQSLKMTVSGCIVLCCLPMECLVYIYMYAGESWLAITHRPCSQGSAPLVYVQCVLSIHTHDVHVRISYTKQSHRRPVWRISQTGHHYPVSQNKALWFCWRIQVHNRLHMYNCTCTIYLHTPTAHVPVQYCCWRAVRIFFYTLYVTCTVHTVLTLNMPWHSNWSVVTTRWDLSAHQKCTLFTRL